MSWKKDIEAIKKLHTHGSKVFRENNGKVLYEYATGSGKSKQAIDNIVESNEKWLIVCWETAHVQNWIDEFHKWNQSKLIINNVVEIICYASLKSYFLKRESSYKVNMVCDEAHHMFSDTYFPYIVGRAKKLQMLTATLPAESKLRMQHHPVLKDVKAVTLSLSKAISLNILPAPGIYIIPISFDSTTRDRKIHIHKGAKVKWEKMPPINVTYDKYRMHMKTTPLNMFVLCTESEAMEYYNNQCNYYQQRFMSSKDQYLNNLWKQSGMQRKNYISDVKTSRAEVFIEEYVGDSRAIIFCGSVEQAIHLGGTLSVHSRNTAKVNRERIAKFQNGETNRLYTNKMLREGMNLANIEKAVIIQLDNKNLAFVQMAGRALRSNFPELFIFHAPLTQDDKYLKNSLAGINKEFVKNIKYYKNPELEGKENEINQVLLGLD